MAEQKSKLPDINEIASMATKLFRDVKTSISQIIDEYKAKHADTETNEVKPPESPKPTVSPSEPEPTQSQTIETQINPTIDEAEVKPTKSKIKDSTSTDK